MRKMKFAAITMTLAALLITSCKNSSDSSASSGPTIYEEPVYERYDDSQYAANVDSEGYSLIDIYGLNDFHGALARNEDEQYPGIARLNKYLLNEREQNKGGTVFIASGDMWQGSAESNISRGKIVNETMNYMGFEAMALGNHEFDWSIEQIEINRAEALFPYLGSNIIYEDSRERVDFVDDSPLIERDGVKIGIIGTMGSDLEDTIQTSLIENIEFDLMTSYVEEEAASLRAQGADIVILATHDSWVESSLRPERLDLLNNKTIDAVFGGHQHVYDKHERNGIPILQTNAYGRAVMHVQFRYNKTTKDLQVGTYDVVEDIFTMDLGEDKITQDIYNYYYQEFAIDEIKNEVVGNLINRDLNRSAIARLAVKVMHDAYEKDNVVGAFHNINGGVRVEKMVQGPVTYGQIYQAFPFDNEIYIVRLIGVRLKGLMSFAGNFAYHFSIDYNDVEDFEYYYVATISFIYEMDGSPVSGTQFENKGTFTRDLIADYFRAAQNVDGNEYY
ncbi:MAG TPA: metallophosphoesterase [Bacilli bacterium]|nr:metallophosphoesterase [Bacilli bacterium]